MTTDHEGGVLAAGTDYHAAINGRQRGVAGIAGRVATLDQDGAEPAIALAGLSAAAFAGALVVAGRHPRPASQMGGAWKAAHVGADLGQDHSGSEALDTGNGAQLFKLLGERGQVLLDPRRQ